VFGADVGSQCLAAGLVDEILVFVLPFLLGAGVSLYRSDADVQDRTGGDQLGQLGLVYPFALQETAVVQGRLISAGGWA
jgi:hypothetical protein